MRFDREEHHRRTIRLSGFNYKQAGAYFVTICTQGRECLFGDIVDGKMRLNDWGAVVREEWLRTPIVRPDIELDAFVVMPNYFHGIICIGDGRGTARRAPTFERFGRPVPGSLPTIIRALKSATTKRVNEMRKAPGTPLWQRNYYERIIRDEGELDRIRCYIQDNPAAWDIDRENPAVEPTKNAEFWQM